MNAVEEEGNVVIEEEKVENSDKYNTDNKIDEEKEIVQENNVVLDENYINPNNQVRDPKKKAFFQDEIKINDQTVLTIPLENLLSFDTEVKKTRKSRWGEQTNRGIKKKIHQDAIFNPFEQQLQTQNSMKMLGPSELAQKGLKQTKFGPVYEKTFQPPPLNYISRTVSRQELEYLLRLYRLDEINKKIERQEFVQQDPDLRSLSPPPIYDAKGMRINTREQRGRENLVSEKNDIIEECMKLNKNFVPPHDYKPLKKQKKIYLPEAHVDDTNYIGLVIGPQGTTQKQLERKCKCKIAIRGKGANNRYESTLPDDDDKLHILIQADSDDKIEKSVELIEKILKQETTEETQDIKNSQMMQLQKITGIFNDFCENCHEKGHKAWNCPNNLKTQTKIKCEICGEYSHVTADCPRRFQNEEDKAKEQDTLEETKEFAKFLQEMEGKNSQKLLAIAQQENKIEKEEKPKRQIQFITETSQRLLALTDGSELVQEEKKPEINYSFPLAARLQQIGVTPDKIDEAIKKDEEERRQKALDQQPGYSYPPIPPQGFPPQPPSIIPPQPPNLMNYSVPQIPQQQSYIPQPPQIPQVMAPIIPPFPQQQQYSYQQPNSMYYPNQQGYQQQPQQQYYGQYPQQQQQQQQQQQTPYYQQPNYMYPNQQK